MLSLVPLAFMFLAPAPQDLFVSGTLDPSQPYPVYRIPALCRTHSGALLAFAEARKSIDDQSSNILVLRRRANRAKAWGPLQVIGQEHGASLNNPTVLATDHEVWVMYQRYPDGLNERTVETGFDSNKTCRTFVVSSRDDGKWWCAPTEITRSIKSPEIRSTAAGPGIGIELKRGSHKGRMLFPFNEGNAGRYSSFAVFSDDHGKSWQRGQTLPKPTGTQPNETQFAELSDGSVLLNARNQAAGRFRLTSVSHDGGGSWEMAQPVPALPDPVCMGSMLRFGFAPSILLFCNAASSQHRVHGLVRLSRDEGKSWQPLSELTGPTESFEYSCLCALSSRSVEVLYETREHSASGREGYRIRFTTVDVPLAGIVAPTGRGN